VLLVEIEGEIDRAIEKLRPDRPLPVVTANFAHVDLLDNWLCHMDRLGIRRLLVIAMDDMLADRLNSAGIPTVRAGFNGSMSDFWIQRAKIWALLAARGVEFINSDTDAVWLRDPISPYSDRPFDMLFSQGTLLPLEAARAWGHVLCCGFFWARPGAAVRRLLETLAASRADGFDDQVALNRLLVSAGTTWSSDTSASYRLQFYGRSFRAYREPVSGFCPSLGLHLMLLPHRLFPRLQSDADPSAAMVRHVLSVNGHAERVSLMRDAGCWLLDAYPSGYIIPR
jgi:hypothetical protein